MEKGTQFYGNDAIAQENARFMTRVYGWMSSGVALTALVSYYAAQSAAFMELILTNKPVFYGLIIAQLVSVLTFSFMIRKLNAFAAAILYFLYAGLTGLTLSVIFMVYTQASLMEVFLLTSVSFAGLSFFGLVTKKDLGPVGSFCMMGLFGLVGYGLLTFFFPSLYSEKGSLITAGIGVVVFAGLIAYDTQKIKAMNIIGNEGTDEDRKEAIHGALVLYLDFINLFLSLLRLMGKRK